MRLRCALSAWLLLAGAATASAGTLTPIADSFVWENGDAKDFSLTWDGSLAVFSVADLGTSTSTSLDACCATLFDRVRELHPDGTLTFSDLAINTYPIDTVFLDNLDFSLFRAGALDNLGTLTGLVTLQWDDPLASMATLGFFVEDPPLEPYGDSFGSMNFVEGDVTSPTPVPEPATLLLLGGGLLAAALAGRRRTPQPTSRKP